MTTAQLFADYLGMTESNAGWAYSPDVRYVGDDDRAEMFMALTATSPLAPEPTPGWLEALVRCVSLSTFRRHGSGNFEAWATIEGGEFYAPAYKSHPTHAVACALIAADPALRERLEACEDWEEVNPC